MKFAIVWLKTKIKLEGMNISLFTYNLNTIQKVKKSTSYITAFFPSLNYKSLRHANSSYFLHCVEKTNLFGGVFFRFILKNYLPADRLSSVARISAGITNAPGPPGGPPSCGQADLATLW